MRMSDWSSDVCSSDLWDLDGLHTEVLTYWPSSLTQEQLAAVDHTDALYELLVDDAITHYEKRESELGEDVMRQVERQVMLRIIDTKWREHLYEMRSEEHTSELQSLMRISYAVFCLKKKN